jgi:DNA polymerase I
MPHALDLNSAIAWDTESTGLRAWHGDSPFAVSMCDIHGDTKYWEFPVDPFTRKVTYNDEDLFEIEAIIGNPNVVNVGHNIKFDVRMLELHCSIITQGEIHETMFSARACNTLEPNYRLKFLSEKYLGYPKDDETDLQKAVVKARAEGKKRGWNLGKDVKTDYWMPKALDPSNNLCEIYARLDAERTMGLYLLHQQEMDRIGVRETYELERKLWHIAYRMETRGVRLSEKKTRSLMQHSKEVADGAYERLQKLSRMSEFNPGSDADVRKVVYSRPGIVAKRLTENGQMPSVDWKALIDYREDLFVAALFEWRSATKAINFYEQYLRATINNTIHCSYNQSAAKTGRFGCQNPNLQQVAKRQSVTGTEPPRAREPFGPRPGYIWYLVDWEQLELRILADLSQEPTLLSAIAEGRDVHAEVANKAWGGRDNPAAQTAAREALGLATAQADGWLDSFSYNIVEAEASLGKKDSRDRAKNVMYGMIYGAGADGLKEILRCSYDQAVSFRNDIHRQFPRIREYGNEIGRQAIRDDCSIRTLYGRRLSIDPSKSYVAINYMIQGSAADLLKHKMVEVDAFIRGTRCDAHMVLTVHDELIFEVHKSCAFPWLLKGIKRIMENTDPPFGVPLPVEISRATECWSKKVKLKL